IGHGLRRGGGVAAAAAELLLAGGRGGEGDVGALEPRAIALGDVARLGRGAAIVAIGLDAADGDGRKLLLDAAAVIDRDEIAVGEADPAEPFAARRLAARGEAEGEWQRVFGAPLDLHDQGAVERVRAFPDRSEADGVAAHRIGVAWRAGVRADRLDE